MSFKVVVVYLVHSQNIFRSHFFFFGEKMYVIDGRGEYHGVAFHLTTVYSINTFFFGFPFVVLIPQWCKSRANAPCLE